MKVIPSFLFKKSQLIMTILGILIYVQTRHNILNEYVINNDASQHLIWLNNWDNYHPNDETISFSQSIQPVGFSATMRFLSNFLNIKSSVILLDIIKGIILLFVSISLSEKWFNENRIKYLFFAALFIVSLNLGNILNSRSYSTVFILLAIYFESNSFTKKSYFQATNLLISSVFYPPSFLIISAFYFIVNLRIKDHNSLFLFTKNNWVILIAICLGLSYNLYNGYELKHNTLVGETINKEFILTDPHVGVHGRVNLIKYWDKPFSAFLGAIPKLFILKNIIALKFTLYVFLLLILVTYFCSNKFQKNSIALILAGIILYVLAVLFPFKFYIPNRYMHYSFGIGLLVFFGMNYVHTPVKKHIYNLIMLVLFSSAIINNIIYSENDFSDLKELYNKCEKNIPPKSMIITNDLKVANMLPYFSKRSVFVSYENLHAIYFKNYREKQDAKMKAWNAIFSTTNQKRLQQLIDTNHINFLVAKEPFFRIINPKDVPLSYRVDSFSGKNALENHSNLELVSEFKVKNENYRIYSLVKFHHVERYP
jgi:hypothetical protein